jgi:F-type H+-transporting ATPase subunit b
VPQLEQIHTFPSQIFWLFVCFAIVYFFLSRLVVPKLSKLISAREETISSSISSAHEAHAGATKLAQDVSKKTSGIKSDAIQILSEASKQASQIYDRGIASCEADVKYQLEKAEGEILTAKKDALQDLNKQVADFVKEVVSKISGLKADKSAIEKLVNDIK